MSNAARSTDLQFARNSLAQVLRLQRRDRNHAAWCAQWTRKVEFWREYIAKHHA